MKNEDKTKQQLAEELEIVSKQLARQQESEQLYRAIFESAVTPMVLIEEDTTLSLVNTEFEELSGYSRAEVEGKKSWMDFVAKDDLLRMKEYHRLRRIDPTAAPKSYTFRFIDRYGKLKYIFVTLGMVPGTKRSIASLMDITERRRLELELRESEEKYRVLAESANDGILVVQDGMVKFANHKVTEFQGLSIEEITSTSFEELVHPDDRQMVAEHYEKRLRGEKPRERYPVRIVDRNGGIRWIETSSSSIMWEGSPAVLSIIRDVTERKQAEGRLEHLNLALRAIRKVNQLIVREKERDRLLKRACSSLIETRGYYNAWIALLDESGRLVTTAEAGLGEDFLPVVERLKRGELTVCGKLALEQSEVVVTEDPRSTCTDCPLADKYQGRGAMTVRLEHGSRVYGSLSISIPVTFVTDRQEQTLLREVAADIALALYAMELEEEREQAEQALRQAREYAEAIVDTVREPLVVLDADLRVVSANRSFYRTFKVTAEETEGRFIYELGNRQWDIPRLRELLEQILPQNTKFDDFVVEHDFPAIGRRTMLLNARRIYRERKKMDMILLAIEDITERKQKETA